MLRPLFELVGGNATAVAAARARGGGHRGGGGEGEGGDDDEAPSVGDEIGAAACALLAILVECDEAGPTRVTWHIRT